MQGYSLGQYGFGGALSSQDRIGRYKPLKRNHINSRNVSQTFSFKIAAMQSIDDYQKPTMQPQAAKIVKVALSKNLFRPPIWVT